MTKIRIGLVGTFDVNNYGDCIFPSVYIHEIKKRLPTADIHLYSPTKNAAQILDYPEIEGLAGCLDDATKMACANYILIGGETINLGHTSGTYIFPEETFSAALRLWLSPLIASSALRGKFLIHAAGLGKISEDAQQHAMQLIRECTRVSVRDNFSSAMLKRFGVDHHVAIDPVFNLRSLRTPNEWDATLSGLRNESSLPEQYLLAQISAPYIKGSLDEWVDIIADIAQEHSLPIVLVPICHFLHDNILMKNAANKLLKLGIEARCVEGLRNVFETAALFHGAYGYIGTSLHGAVSAIAFEKYAAIYATTLTGKHQGVMESVGLTDIVVTDIDRLPEALNRCMQYDLEKIRLNAIELASAGLDQMCQEILHGNLVKPSVISDEEVESVIVLDRAPILGLSHKLKRAILKVTKNNKLLGPLYFYLQAKFRGIF
jgi:polysaccharide pyruvyl transferase WcaK-like protein